MSIAALILGCAGAWIPGTAKGAAACAGPDAARPAEVRPTAGTMELLPAAPSCRPAGRVVGPGGGEAADPLRVIQTEYGDSILGNVALLIWDAVASAGLDVLVDGAIVGTFPGDAGAAFITSLDLGERMFGLQDAAGGTGFSAEAALVILAQAPFGDPGGLACKETTGDEKGICAVRLSWTPPDSLPDYYLIVLDGDTSLEVGPSASEAVFPDVPSGVHEWTIIGFQEQVPGSRQTLYRGNLIDTSCSVSCVPSNPFIRGICGVDRAPRITGAVRLLTYMFLGGPEPPCLDACDFNDSGTLTIGDAVYLLYFMFLGGAVPPPPYPGCGMETTGHQVGCATAMCT
jgi:hypothetical protein